MQTVPSEEAETDAHRMSTDCLTGSSLFNHFLFNRLYCSCLKKDENCGPKYFPAIDELSLKIPHNTGLMC